MPKFFGQFLLEKGMISREQLLDALYYQRCKVEKLGEIAAKKGYLKEEDIQKIHQVQQSVDLKFGDIAVKMGLLTPEQLEELVNIQENNHIYLGQALVEIGYITPERLEELLNQFQEEEKQEVISEIEIPLSLFQERMTHQEVLFIFADITIKLLRRVADILTKTSEVRVERIYTINSFLSILITFTGDLQGKFLLKLSKRLAYEITKKLIRYEELEEDDPIIIDAAGEFFNMICGNVASKLLELGKNIDISIPRPIKGDDSGVINLGKTEKAFVFPLFTTEGFGEVQLILDEE